jgi:hydrogenase nickel incorporation protein HypA/HybF
MHEYPITQHILEMAEERCREGGASRVRKIKLVCGDYCGYVPESIQMYFDVMQEGTLCEGATVEIKRIKPKLKCPACGEVFERKPMSFACPICGTDGGPTDIGKEFYIESIEVE